MGTRESVEEAEKLLNSMNQEKLVLWYHDMYKRYLRELEQARGSGLIKELRDRREELEKGETMPMARLERELEEEENKRSADFIDAKGDKRKVFYYDGLYGSVVVDVESDRLLGKIEGIVFTD